MPCSTKEWELSPVVNILCKRIDKRKRFGGPELHTDNNTKTMNFHVNSILQQFDNNILLHSSSSHEQMENGGRFSVIKYVGENIHHQASLHDFERTPTYDCDKKSTSSLNRERHDINTKISMADDLEMQQNKCRVSEETTARVKQSVSEPSDEESCYSLSSFVSDQSEN
jgi:hypothetical protein